MWACGPINEPLFKVIYTCTFRLHGRLQYPGAGRAGGVAVSHVSAFLKVRMAMHGCCVSVRSVIFLIRDVQYIDRVVECWRCGRGWAARRRALGAPSLQFQSVCSPEDAHSEGDSQPSRRADAADARAVALAWLGLG